MSVLPRISTSGLGSVSVIGRIRVPSPAANTMAVLGTGLIGASAVLTSEIGFGGKGTQRPRQVILIPERERLKQRMGEVALEVALDPRQVAQVVWLAVALVQSCEEAEDLGCALRAHRRIGGGETLGIERRIGARPPAARRHHKPAARSPRPENR